MKPTFQISREQAIKLIIQSKKRKFISIVFKKQNGEIRKLNGKFVNKITLDRFLFKIRNGYRQFYINNLTEVHTNKVIYKIDG